MKEPVVINIEDAKPQKSDISKYPKGCDENSKDRLMALCKIIVDICSSEEIEILATSLLNANLQVKCQEKYQK